MHNYTHEYKSVTKKVKGKRVTFLSYLGSRCKTEGCPDQRKRAILDLVKRHNDETGERLWVDTHDTAFRRRFAEQAQAREAQFRQSMAHAGVDTLELRTDEPLDQAVLDFIRMRQPRRWLSQGARSR